MSLSSGPWFLLCLLGCASALHLERFALESDYSAFFDLLLGKFVSSYPAYLPFTPLNISFSQVGAKVNTPPIGYLTAPSSSVGDFSTVGRVGNVTSSVGGGNLTIEAKIKFGTLTILYPEVQLQMLGLSLDTSAKVTVGQNLFDLAMTMYSTKTGDCAMDLKKASFSVLSGITLQATPLGFFDQMTLSGLLNHVSQTVLAQFNDFNKQKMQSDMQTVACSLVPA